mmetsp:Transcript_12568/g.20901  ORF Transcript_12568/g.20901 Transcript_12568/m.20901 type:complete len:85 (-) Transcript_12568:263-517(-)
MPSTTCIYAAFTIIITAATLAAKRWLFWSCMNPPHHHHRHHHHYLENDDALHLILSSSDANIPENFLLISSSFGSSFTMFSYSS